MPISISDSTDTVSLEGSWSFALDREDRGVKEGWYARPLEGSAILPGDLASQGIGDPIDLDTPWIGSLFDASFFDAPRYAPYREAGAIKVPFWLQPDRRYSGAAWYQREAQIPEHWVGKRVTLRLERPHWKTTVWVDDVELGSDASLSAPHVYDLGVVHTAGPRSITLRVDNSLIVDIGENSHSISDHTQGNWNGVVGRIELTASEAVWVEGLRVEPDAGRKQVRVSGRVRNLTGSEVGATLVLSVEPEGEAAPLNGETVELTLAAVRQQETFELVYLYDGDASLWDEFSPALYFCSLTLRVEGRSAIETASSRFGFRSIEAEGRQLKINGRKLFLRGTLECAIFPKTGHPPTDRASWEKVYSTVKAYGLNHVRFHSWCPPEAAFAVADERGVYLQVEAASWPNQSVALGDGAQVDLWLESESKRVLETYGNHPSFILMASGNEPGGEHHAAWLAAWLERRKSEDSRRLYTSAAGWPMISESQYHVHSEPRIQHWGEGLESRINKLPPETMTDYAAFIAESDAPVVSHEIGQWCVYPNFEEMGKYTGYLKPRNFEIFRDWLEEKRMGHLARSFLLASGKLQALCYKEDIESALRTGSMGGFQLLDLHDFPGQGTALVGVLDPFWDEKGYISAREYRRFCGPVTPLARLPKRVFTEGETVTVQLEVAQYGPRPISGAHLYWKLCDNEENAVQSGMLAPSDLEVGLVQLGQLEIDTTGLDAPGRYRFVLGLEGTEYENDWDIWVYPRRHSVQGAGESLVVSELHAAAEAALGLGETVVLQIPPERVKGDAEGSVQLGFSTIFWNTSWTNGQAPHTMGLLCDPDHPALSRFPTDFHSDWQWWYVIAHASAMILDGLPADVEPIIRVVDDWFRARRLALAFEAKVGKGRLIVTSVDLDAADNLVMAQLKESVLAYARDAGAMRDLVELTPQQVRSLYE